MPEFSRLIVTLAALIVLGGCLSPTPPPAEAPATTPAEAPPRRAEQPATPDPPTTPAPAAPADKSELEYIEVVTGGAAAEDPLPLIVAVHGLGDRPESFGRLVRGYSKPARFIMPRAPEPYHEGYSWFPLGRPLDNPPEPVIAQMKRSAARLAALIEELKVKRPTRGEPVILGFSQGGLMSYLVATRHPTRVKAALPVSGWLPNPLIPTALPASAPTIRAMHGESDTLIPAGPTQAMVEKMTRLGFQVTLKTWPGVPHTITRPMREELFGYLDALVQEAP